MYRYRVNKRIRTVFFLFLFLFIVVCCRLLYLQVVRYPSLREMGEDLWLRDLTLEAPRGEIVDRYQRIIVTNKRVKTLLIVPRQIEDKERVITALASALALDRIDLEKKLSQDVSVIKLREAIKLPEHISTPLQKKHLAGLYFVDDYERDYPYTSLLAHVLGFTGVDQQGLLGIEHTYDDMLKGVSGRMRYYTDAKGRRLPQETNQFTLPTSGNALTLTIDLDIQKIVERELDQAVATYQPDQALVIVQNPQNGEILAMASRPTFIPNDYQQVLPTVYNRNLPIWSTYEPGSTFKIITLSAALEEGVVDLEHEHYYDSGSIKVSGQHLRCWKRGGHKDQTFLEVVENSCNPGFVVLGQRVGKDQLFDYIDRFGFGKKTGIELNGEAHGILFNLEQVGPVELATTAFGQGVVVTPIQQVMAVSAAVNGGKLYRPTIIKSPNGLTAKNRFIRQVISESTSKKVRDALESVVAKGTGRGAYVEGYRVGGKTGTAQKVGENGRYLENNHVVSFIGIAPMDQPEVVVYVAIDNPKNTMQFGGVVAAPIAGRIIDDILTVKGVEKSDGITKEVDWPEKRFVEVPNYIGRLKSDVLNSFDYFELSIKGEGDHIINQRPEPGTKVREGSNIELLLSGDN